jgi:hypothetical protein
MLTRLRHIRLRDLLDALREETPPNLQYLIKDLFEEMARSKENSRLGLSALEILKYIRICSA